MEDSIIASKDDLQNDENLPTRTGEREIVNSPRSFSQRSNGINLSNGSRLNSFH